MESRCKEFNPAEENGKLQTLDRLNANLKKVRELILDLSMVSN